jgi:hypothetical protein
MLLLERVQRCAEVWQLKYERWAAAQEDSQLQLETAGAPAASIERTLPRKDSVMKRVSGGGEADESAVAVASRGQAACKLLYLTLTTLHSPPYTHHVALTTLHSLNVHRQRPPPRGTGRRRRRRSGRAWWRGSSATIRICWGRSCSTRCWRPGSWRSQAVGRSRGCPKPNSTVVRCPKCSHVFKLCPLSSLLYTRSTILTPCLLTACFSTLATLY